MECLFEGAGRNREAECFMIQIVYTMTVAQYNELLVRGEVEISNGLSERVSVRLV